MRAEFSLKALYDALDNERRRRDLSWTAVAREINSRFRDVPGHKPIAVSTITGLQTKAIGEGDGILQMLLWLGRSPESFVPGVKVNEANRLRELGTCQILRWDTRALYEALDERRGATQKTWQQVANELGGGFTPSVLKALGKGGRTSFPGVMTVAAWLERPAASFTRVSDW